MNTPYKPGTILRYHHGPTALFQVRQVSENHAGLGWHRYYGLHCMGGQHTGSYHADCSIARKEDLKIWSDCAKWRPTELGEFDLVRHLHRQRRFSHKTFGPGRRLTGLLDHIRKELTEIEASPDDAEEWADLILLAFDGAWRAGLEPEQIAFAIDAKQIKNEGRDWPDWRTADPGKAIEHVREESAE